MKTCVIMQPTYLPWLGYFDLINQADVFVFLDHVQFSKQSWQQRNKIRNREGEQLLTIPVINSHLVSLINTKIDHSRSPLDKHLKSIKQNHSKSKNYVEIIQDLESIYSIKHDRLIDLNIALIELGIKRLDLKTEIYFSSDLNFKGEKVEVLIDICNHFNVDRYLSPQGAKSYIEENNLFLQSQIILEFHNYTHPIYRQLNYNDFISHLAFIDYLFNK